MVGRCAKDAVLNVPGASFSDNAHFDRPPAFLTQLKWGQLRDNATQIDPLKYPDVDLGCSQQKFMVTNPSPTLTHQQFWTLYTLISFKLHVLPISIMQFK